jgi:hypothetical protein
MSVLGKNGANCEKRMSGGRDTEPLGARSFLEALFIVVP